MTTSQVNALATSFQQYCTVSDPGGLLICAARCGRADLVRHYYPDSSDSKRIEAFVCAAKDGLQECIDAFDEMGTFDASALDRLIDQDDGEGLICMLDALDRRGVTYDMDAVWSQAEAQNKANCLLHLNLDEPNVDLTTEERVHELAKLFMSKTPPKIIRAFVEAYYRMDPEIIHGRYNGETLLQRACIRKETKPALEFLLDQTEDLISLNHALQSYINCHRYDFDEELIIKMLERGANPLAKTIYGDMPIVKMSTMPKVRRYINQEEVRTSILKPGGPRFFLSVNDFDFIFYESNLLDADMFRILFAYGFAANSLSSRLVSYSKEDVYPIHRLLKYPSLYTTTLLKMFVNTGADVFCGNEHPLFMAMNAFNIPAIEFLFKEQKMKKDEVDKHGCTIQEAFQKIVGRPQKKEELKRALMAHGVEWNIRREELITAFTRICSSNSRLEVKIDAMRNVEGYTKEEAVQFLWSNVSYKKLRGPFMKKEPTATFPNGLIPGIWFESCFIDLKYLYPPEELRRPNGDTLELAKRKYPDDIALHTAITRHISSLSEL